jgi:3-mercaptopyruvate sulfurtransferase SseA
MPYGLCLEQMGFPGTLSLRPGTLIAVLEDLFRDFYHHGFRRVLVVNGHGGNNAPWTENLTGGADQVFRSPPELQARFASLGVDDQRDVICSCGSGVTACHNIFALELAGFSQARLYPGSWSEWIVRHP